ncbi:hypothetical protein [Evansella clarkii]|uniref:hypothetical protein n=1 Tax=Evansella clarkii TaxID=79879 RepID=UPI000B42DFC0|nr:hypothetical protein [Evansella clarkii]
MKLSLTEYREKKAALRAAKESKDFNAVVELSNQIKDVTISGGEAETIDDLRNDLKYAQEQKDISEVIRLSNELKQKVNEQLKGDDL